MCRNCENIEFGITMLVGHVIVVFDVSIVQIMIIAQQNYVVIYMY